MTSISRFSPADSLGAMDHGQIAQYLIDLQDATAAQLYLATSPTGQTFGLRRSPWDHTGCSIGFIAPSSDKSVPLIGASELSAESSLIGKRIKITLDKFYVQSYPGLGSHRILCEFAGKNQVPNDTEELRFALTTTVKDGESAGISGHPIFMGVTVGKDGISFEGRTVNVASTVDDVVLQTLDTPAFKNGLSLLTTIQPALKPFSGLAAAVVNASLTRSKNRQIHTFNLGLDFGSNATSSRLRIGSYLVAQTDGASWDWSSYVWDRTSNSLRAIKESSGTPKINYMVFGVTEFTGA